MLPIIFAMTYAGREPLALHPRNPHIFVFRGKPVVLVTSSGHYGQVLNLDFDWRASLAELRRWGFNYTRIFSGVYWEEPGDFNIRANILAPSPGRVVCPWARVKKGAADGGGPFDLSRWDEAYFRRIKAFVGEAARFGIVVEVTLFCPFYTEGQWRLSPMNAANNVNGVGGCSREEVYTLQHADLTRVQEEVTRKLVRELNGFDNVFYEICNEPYFGGVTMDWQKHIAGVITEEEAHLPHRHLIAQNIANGSASVQNPHPNVSLLNFHYASPPDAVRENYHLNRAIGFDETGFRGTEDRPYRVDAWEFMLAGGALYDHLDYSFTVAHPDGTEVVTDPTPGGGGPRIREQLSTLLRFLKELDLVAMTPFNNYRIQPEAAGARVLASSGKEYAAYVHGARQMRLVLEMPPGRYRAEWVDPVDGRHFAPEEIEHAGGSWEFHAPSDLHEAALRVVRISR
ncbi:MAG: hypothetical protein ACP5VE_11445 [Chthonomonadales bacterium]